MTEHLKEEREEAMFSSRGKEFSAKGTASAQVTKGSGWAWGEQLGSQGDLEQMGQGRGWDRADWGRASPAAVRALTILSRKAV